MPTAAYLIVGGGMTAASAVQGIRDVDPEGSIALLCSEIDPPYDRPPLSKGLWKGESRDGIWRPVEGPGVTLHLGRTARHLDPGKRRVIDDQGTGYDYRKLLLATGGTPRRLPLDGGESIVYFRTLRDYDRLRALSSSAERFAVIGGGFIGSEIAAALAMSGKTVSLIFPDRTICGRMFPAGLAEFVTDYYRAKGVRVFAGSRVVSLRKEGSRTVLGIRSIPDQGEREIVADGVVAGVGIEPNVDLARSAGLEVDNGIRVDASLRTSHPDIYAAGDVANFQNPALGRRLRVEHEDNANTMGELAGQAMAGRAVVYDHLPFFYSDLFELGYEAVGELDARLESVADWEDPNRKGVVYYLGEGRVRGVLLWNVWEQVDAARTLIAEPGPFRPEHLKGRLAA